MRLEIDTSTKTVKVIDHAVTIGDLIKELAILFPEEEFKEYTLISEPPPIIYSPTSPGYTPPSNPWGGNPTIWGINTNPNQ